jgi:hypothetical protein
MPACHGIWRRVKSEETMSWMPRALAFLRSKLTDNAAQLNLAAFEFHDRNMTTIRIGRVDGALQALSLTFHLANARVFDWLKLTTFFSFAVEPRCHAGVDILRVESVPRAAQPPSWARDPP